MVLTAEWPHGAAGAARRMADARPATNPRLAVAAATVTAIARPEPRRKLVKRWHDRVKRAQEHWEPVFKRMRENMEFGEGRQWPTCRRTCAKRDDRYVANICIRHVLQRTAELYPNNPKMQAKSKPKLIAQTWDGTCRELQQAQQAMMMAAQSGMPPDPQRMMVLQDARRGQQFDEMMEQIGKHAGAPLRIQHPASRPTRSRRP